MQRVGAAGLSLYKTLGAAQNATPAQLKLAYRNALLANHPDKAGNTSQANERTGQIVDAYATLSNPALRKAYDRTLRPAATAPQPSRPSRPHQSATTGRSATTGFTARAYRPASVTRPSATFASAPWTSAAYANTSRSSGPTYTGAAFAGAAYATAGYATAPGPLGKSSSFWHAAFSLVQPPGGATTDSTTTTTWIPPKDF